MPETEANGLFLSDRPEHKKVCCYCSLDLSERYVANAGITMREQTMDLNVSPCIFLRESEYEMVTLLWKLNSHRQEQFYLDL